MEFGGLDFGFESHNNNSSVYGLDPDTKWFGSLGGGGLLKQEKPLSVSTAAAHNHIEDEWREMKMAKTSQDDFSKATLQQQRSNSGSHVFYDTQNMLSFSSPTLPYCARSSTGYGMRGVIGGVRGPFTPSQWMELEHQALIFKYITLNAPIPSNLLIPIRKALEAAAYHTNPRLANTACYGWGGFQLGFSNNSDPEPGRCRRTDGKKWRCSREAVPDQKYCERHMNRGRHRSRKPVEGQTGHSVSNGALTTSTTTTAVPPKVSPSAAVSRHHNPAPPYSHDNRNFLNSKGVTITMGSEKVIATTPLSILSGLSIDLKQNPPSVSLMPQSEFGLVCSDSLLNPLHKNGNADQKSQNSLRQFIDDRTQLSISIPMGSASSSDLISSSTSSPISERLNLSPLRMGLGVGNTINNTNTDMNASWIPVSWETSMGGPLGEVLHHSTNNSPSTINLMTDGWESGQNMALSPTGVLQKTGFGSLSNSSAGSSPRTDSNLLGSTLIASSLPLL